MIQVISRSVLFIGICCVLCACASATLKAPIIENSVPAPRALTRAGNVAATVSVFYTFSNPDTGEMFHYQVIGVVVDPTHVLAVTTHESDAAWLIGWKRANFVFASVMPYIPDVSERLIEGPASRDGWLAKIAVNVGHVGILEVSQSMPIYPVVFATKTPSVGEYVYALGRKSYDQDASVGDETFVQKWNGKVVKPQLVYKWQYNVFARDFALKLFKDKYPVRCGVFNKHHEFVGFFTTETIEITSNHFGSRDYGYRVMSLKSLAPFLLEAGILYTPAD